MRKSTLKPCLFLLLFSLLFIEVKAQKRGNFQFVRKDSSKIEIINVIKKMKGLTLQDPDGPKFLLVNKKQNFALGVGGQVRVVAGSEFGGIIATETNQGFEPSMIPIPYGENPKSQLRLSAATSQFYVKMVNKTRKLGNVETFVSINFQGDNYTPEFRQAYVKIGGFKVGQTWSTFTDLGATPPTIDYAGPVSMVSVRNPLISYSPQFRNTRHNTKLSAEFPTVNATYSATAKNTPQSIPDIIGYYQYNWGTSRDSHIRASGLLRNMAYSNYNISSTEIEQGWGAKFNAVIGICRTLKFYGQGIIGKGIGSYMNDISTQNLDLVPESNTLGYLDKMKMWGATGGLQCTLAKDLYLSSSYSYSRVYDTADTEVTPLTYKFSQYIVSNMFWNLTKECTLAVEYLRGMKNVFNGNMGHSNRVNLMIQYSF